MTENAALYQPSALRPVPSAEIVYEPSPIYRMRYEAENRSTHLVSENFTPEKDNTLNNKKNKKKQSYDGQYPRVRILNGEGPATLIVSCVNKTEPYHVHPHKLVGQNCKHGVAVFNINKGEHFFDVSGVTIQFTKKSDIEKRIQELKEKNVDPFNVGFEFERQSIDLSSVRLCFQIYLRDSFETTEIIRDKYHILKPVVSQIISNSSRKVTLTINSTFNLSSTCDGGSDVVIFIKKLEKDQKPLKVKFYDTTGWSSIVDIEDSQIHYQCAINFKAPKYPKQIDKEATVYFKLFIPLKNDKDHEEECSLGSPSSNLSSPDSKQLGQYESKEIEFVYRPSVYSEPLDQSKLTKDFFGFSDQADKEAVNIISFESRKNLYRRQMGNMKIYNQELSNESSNFSFNDIVYTNNLAIKNEMYNSSTSSYEQNNLIEWNHTNQLINQNQNIDMDNIQNLIESENSTGNDFENIDTTDLFFNDIVDSIFLNYFP